MSILPCTERTTPMNLGHIHSFDGPLWKGPRERSWLCESTWTAPNAERPRIQLLHKLAGSFLKLPNPFCDSAGWQVVSTVAASEENMESHPGFHLSLEGPNRSEATLVWRTLRGLAGGWNFMMVTFPCSQLCYFPGG